MRRAAGLFGHSLRRGAAAAAVVLASAATVSATAHAEVAGADVPSAEASEPRAFGYRVGDVVPRRVAVHVPAGFSLDERSLPKVGQRGQALELRRVEWRGSGAQHELQLDYQVFVSPRELRTLEMPAFTLRLEGAPREQLLRIDAWPVVVAPLAPADAPARNGLGELRPDAAPPLIDTAPMRMRLGLIAAALALLGAYLGVVYLGPPWRASRHRPFAVAWRGLSGLPLAPSATERRAAYTRLHEALNRAAGEVLFEPGLDRWFAAQPRYAPLRAELVEFFARSRAVFFSMRADVDADTDASTSTGASAVAVAVANAGTRGGSERDWLVAFCRRCRDVERGSA